MFSHYEIWWFVHFKLIFIRFFVNFVNPCFWSIFSSTFIYIDNQTNAAANPYASIPVDEHIERRFNYYAVAGLDYYIGRHFYIVPHVKLYFDEIEIDEKMVIKDRTNKTQFRPGIEFGFIF